MAKSINSTKFKENIENEYAGVGTLKINQESAQLAKEKRAVLGNICNKPNPCSSRVRPNINITKISNNLNRLELKVDARSSQASSTCIPIFKKSVPQNVKIKTNIYNSSTTVSQKSIQGNEFKQKFVVAEDEKRTAIAPVQVSEVTNDELEQIDEIDRNNPYLMSIYVKDIYNYLRTLESETLVREDYLNGRDIKPRMRATLIDWLIDVHVEFGLLQETLHLGVWILDYYLEHDTEAVRKNLQLIGITALYLACKYEEILAPDVTDCVKISDNAFMVDEIFEKERDILKALDFKLGRPISVHFLRRFSKASSALSKHHNLAKYILDLSLLDYSLCHIKPSVMAASALYLAFLVYNNMEYVRDEVWNKTVIYHSTYDYEDLRPVVKIMAGALVNATKQKFQSVVRKYASVKFMNISLKSDIITDDLKKFAAEE